MSQPIKRTASAEIIVPKVPPLPECGASKTHALLTIAPPAPVRTAASDKEVRRMFENGNDVDMDSFCEGFRAAEQHHGIGGGQ